MQPTSLKCLACAALFIGLSSQGLWANTDGNPYATIVDRNPFGLKPPPPPAPAPEQTVPPVPMAQVTLTGLLSTFGEPRVILEIVEEPGKGGGTPKRPPPMREGERLGQVEILSIDVIKNTVRIRNSTVETNITFAVAKSTPAPSGAGVPAGAPPTFTPPPPLSTASSLAPSSSPTVISANGAIPGGGVTLFGGGGAVTPMSTGGGVSSFGGANSVGAASFPGALGAQSGGTPTIPPRPLRTPTESAAANDIPMTKDQVALLIEAQRLKGGPPLPPTHLTPLIEGAQQEAGQGNANPFPRLPTPGGPPPLPGR